MDSRVILPVPVPARVISMCLSLVTISVLTFCLSRRIMGLRNWRTLPLTSLLIIMIYIDNFFFVFSATVASKSFSVNESMVVCDGVTFICLFFYMSSKIITYYFLVEKVYIIRGSTSPLPRLKTKLWCFNFFGVICPFVVLVILNFVFRISYFRDDGTCIVGMKRAVLDPLIAFDTVINVYLTSLFLSPLRKCYSYKHNTNSRLKTMVMRTFIGSCTTLFMSVTNLSILTILDGEPAYVCLTCCNADILFSVMVLHWATSIDRPEPSTTNPSSGPSKKSHHQSQGSRGQLSMPGGSKIDKYIELQDTNTILTTKIEANKVIPGDEEMAVGGIEVKTQHVREVEVGSFETLDMADARWGRDSQERIMPADV